MHFLSDLLAFDCGLVDPRHSRVGYTCNFTWRPAPATTIQVALSTQSYIKRLRVSHDKLGKCQYGRIADLPFGKKSIYALIFFFLFFLRYPIHPPSTLKMGRDEYANRPFVPKGIMEP